MLLVIQANSYLFVLSLSYARQEFWSSERSTFLCQSLTIFCRCCIYLKVTPFTRNRDAEILEQNAFNDRIISLFYTVGIVSVACSKKIQKTETASASAIPAAPALGEIVSGDSSASHVKNHTRAKYQDQVHVPARLALLFNFPKQNSLALSC